MPRSPYLTKSRFTLAAECPTKLYYTGKPYEYPDSHEEDDFLAALAEGGMQVGEYAKLVWPGGTEVTSRSSDRAVKETLTLLQQDNITLYEPAFLFKDMLVRVDVLIKTEKRIKLIEVKAKSFRSVDEWYNRAGTDISSSWRQYLLDVAFQKYVVQGALNSRSIESYLAVCNKEHAAVINGLYGNFVIRNEDGRAHVSIQNQSIVDAGILACENADNAVDLLWKDSYSIGDKKYSFTEYANRLAKAYRDNERLHQPISAMCKECEFKLPVSVNSKNEKSGFHECWLSQTSLTEEDLSRKSVLDLWNYRGKQNQLDKSVYLLRDMDINDLGEIEPGEQGLSAKERQQLQILKEKSNDTLPYVDKGGLQFAISQVVYPIHMIDFETTSTALPFHANRRPYEQIAFQFSHHTIEADGTIRHSSQWINPNPTQFPNFEFVRQLKRAIGDTGSVFRYAVHENSILNAIHRQLDASNESDKLELKDWIETITYSKDGAGRVGTRNMIDLCTWVKNFYFDPATNGSNSIKAILPSILSRSTFLQKKYSQPIYGQNIPSLNLGPTIWIKEEEGKIVSPYSQLPKLSFLDYMDADGIDAAVDRLLGRDELANGGAAMVAYNYMQFESMGEVERKVLRDGLFRYCELDTLAMVMLWEGLKDLAHS